MRALFGMLGATRLGILAVASLLLSSCFMTAGKYDASMTIDRGYHFSFAYRGEIFMLAFSPLMDMAATADAETAFKPSCVDENDLGERECSPDEVAEQREQWEEGAEERAARRREQAESMKRLLGGLDPSSPQAIDEFIARLTRQRGWNSVVHKGGGVFAVDFAVTGTLDRDFAFPTMERVEGALPFVLAFVRQDGTVRVEATGLVVQDPGSGMGAIGPLAGIGAMLGATGKDGAKANGQEAPPLPEGTFRLAVEGEVLANNTDEGPAQAAGRKLLSWTTSPRSRAAPSALVRPLP